MARMYPEEIEGYEKATEGEKKVFRFLREAARPHKDYRCWYDLRLVRSKRSLILFGRHPL
jgi:hypothetical protein